MITQDKIIFISAICIVTFSFEYRFYPMINTIIAFLTVLFKSTFL